MGETREFRAGDEVGKPLPLSIPLLVVPVQSEGHTSLSCSPTQRDTNPTKAQKPPSVSWISPTDPVLGKMVSSS